MTARGMARGGQRGFSLVELMVALTLSLVLMAGALSILYTSRLTYTENDRLARIQEAGRTAMELMLRDLRASGFQGCSRPMSPLDFVNGLNGGGTVLWNVGVPLAGYEAAGAGWTPAVEAEVAPDPAPTAGSDILVIRTTRQGQPVFRTNAPVTAPDAVISVDRPANATVPAGTPMIISDCRGASAFVTTGIGDVSAVTATISHVAGGIPGNVSDSITRAFEIGAQVTPVETVIYYVAPSTSGNGPGLWQQVGNGDPEMLIEGVENLQFLYGEDTDGDLLVNNYVTADAVGNWANVVSLSLAILIRSEVETGPQADSRVYDLLGEEVGPFNDRRQRSIFTTTVSLRNRAT